MERLARALLPSDPSLAERVRLARSDAAEYVRVHAKELRLRGITKATDTNELQLIALLDGLIAANALEEIDWREDPSAAFEFVQKLRILPEGTRAVRDVHPLETEPDEESPVSAFLTTVARELSSAGLSLLAIDAGTDSHPILCVDAEKTAELTRLAREEGVILVNAPVEGPVRNSREES